MTSATDPYVNRFWTSEFETMKYKGAVDGVAPIANKLGGLILSNLTHAGLSRQNITEHQRKKYFVVVDEFSSFTSATFGDILSELRKYKLGLITASQYLNQIDANIVGAILGNVGSKTSFRIGANDAPVMAKQFGSSIPSARDLVGLANYKYYAKLMVNGVQSKPFSAKTISPYQLTHSHNNA